jgi:hypothetical protein
LLSFAYPYNKENKEYTVIMAYPRTRSTTNGGIVGDRGFLDWILLLIRIIILLWLTTQSRIANPGSRVLS